METIPCTIETFSDHGEDFWVIHVPASAAKDAAARFSELLSGTRKRIVFLDRKTEFILTTDTATYNGRSVLVTRDFPECLEKFFSREIRPGIDHIDWDLSDKHGNIGITVRIVP